MLNLLSPKWVHGGIRMMPTGTHYDVIKRRTILVTRYPNGARDCRESVFSSYRSLYSDYELVSEERHSYESVSERRCQLEARRSG